MKIVENNLKPIIVDGADEVLKVSEITGRIAIEAENEADLAVINDDSRLYDWLDRHCGKNDWPETESVLVRIEWRLYCGIRSATATVKSFNLS